MLTHSRFQPRLERLEDRCVPATITVTKLTDGIGVPGMTLREAIDKANQTVAADTIVFKTGLKGTLLLTGGEMLIEESLKINGPGASKITIDAGGASRIFNIDGNSLFTATISKLSLTGGAGEGGGAILSLENLTLNKVRFFGNRATAEGGAVHVDQGAVLTVSGCSFHDNQANAGGGALFATQNTVRISNSTFQENRGVGGALRFINADVELTGCVLTGNSALAADGDGGALDQDGGTLVIHASTISNNAAFNGGGIFVNGVDTLITSSTIAANTANGDGGAIAVSGGGSDLIVRNSTISGNHAIGNGGGIAINDGDSINIQNSTIAFNNSVLGGGGIYSQTDVDLISTIVAKNLAFGLGQDLRSLDSGADIFSYRFSLIGADPGAAAGLLDLGGNLALGTNPLLGPLQNNGGPTLTHALLAGSPALNVSADPAANPGSLTRDQRGGKFKRVKGGAIDIGAFER